MKKLLFNILMLLSLVATAQFEIPDTNFLNFIKRDYPYAITADNLLDTISADTVQGYFDLDDEGVYSIEGVQYFKSVLGVFCDSNYITDLSPIRTLTDIKALHCHANQLTELPDFSSFTNLQFLYCFDNELDEINGLEFTELKLLDLHGNNFTELDVLPELKDLEILYLQDNELENLPALDSLISLKEVNLDNNNLKEIGPLAHLSNIKEFTARGNQLNFVTLQHVVDHPEIDSSYTWFDFSGQKYVYSMSLEDDVLVGESDTLRCPDHFTSPYNIYQWYYNAAPIPGANDSIYIMDDAQIAQSGVYLCRIMNTYDPKLSFVQFDAYYVPVTITCFDISEDAISAVFNDCNTGWQISIDDSEIRANAAFQVELYSNDSQVEETSVNSYEQLFQSEYRLEVSDGISCTLDTVISRPDAPDCDEDLIFSPNGDGEYDDFYVEGAGEARIYNKSGQLIKTLIAPTSWDGSDLTNLTVPDGYYVIIINNETVVHVAVKR